MKQNLTHGHAALVIDIPDSLEDMMDVCGEGRLIRYLQERWVTEADARVQAQPFKSFEDSNARATGFVLAEDIPSPEAGAVRDLLMDHLSDFNRHELKLISTMIHDEIELRYPGAVQ